MTVCAASSASFYELMVRSIGYSTSAFWLEIIHAGHIGSSSRWWDFCVCLPCSTPFPFSIVLLAFDMASRMLSLLLARCFRVALGYSHPRPQDMVPDDLPPCVLESSQAAGVRNFELDERSRLRSGSTIHSLSLAPCSLWGRSRERSRGRGCRLLC